MQGKGRGRWGRCFGKTELGLRQPHPGLCYSQAILLSSQKWFPFSWELFFLSDLHLRPGTEYHNTQTRHARTRGFSILETNLKLLHPVLKASMDKMLPCQRLSFYAGHWMQLQPAPNSLFVQRINTPIERIPRNGLSSALLWGCQAESPVGSVLLAELQAWKDEASWGAPHLHSVLLALLPCPQPQ